MHRTLLWALPVIALVSAAVAFSQLWSSDTPVLGYRVVSRLPHDPTAFTQGLLFSDGVFYESTGKRGLSRVRRVEPKTGVVIAESRLPADVFGEGLTEVGDQLIQLSWTAGKAYFYDRASLERQQIVRYDGEGWGLTHDGRHLVISDGSSTLRFLDPQTLKEERRIQVLDGERPVVDLNELEWIDGRIWANVWKSNRIARIHPRTGKVEAWIDLEGLHPPMKDEDDVLNGIAWDAGGKRLFVTGKRWDTLYQIEVVEKD